MLREAILPLGKRQAFLRADAPELIAVEGRSLLEWAVIEALQAGAARITLVTPWPLAETGRFFEVAEKALHESRAAGRPCGLNLVLGCVSEAAGWDSLVWQGAEYCQEEHFLLLDPTMLLLSAGQAAARGSLLPAKAMPGAGAAPRALFATVRGSWEQALPQAVLATRRGRRLFCRLDRSGEESDIFAGLAILPRALPAPRAAGGWTPDHRFPYETLIESATAALPAAQLRLPGRIFDGTLPGDPAAPAPPDTAPAAGPAPEPAFAQAAP